MPQANSHSTWALASQGGYLWQFANCEQRYVTYLQREIRAVPVRSKDVDTRLGDRELLRARAGVTARAAGVLEGRRSVPIRGRWRFAVVGRDLPTTHARACVASSLCCGSDRRLRVSTPAQAGLRMSECEGAGCRVPGAGVKTRPHQEYFGKGINRVYFSGIYSYSRDFSVLPEYPYSVNEQWSDTRGA